jgi:hypothetical protein
MKYLVLLIVIVFFSACGIQKKLNREYSGKPLSVVKESFGEPKIILDNEDGQIYVYEKEEELGSTEISQGRLTLDPIVTPKVVKTKRYYFTVKNDIVISSKFEEEYNR